MTFLASQPVHGILVSQKLCETLCGAQSQFHSVGFFFDHSVERPCMRLYRGGVKFGIPRHLPTALHQAIKVK